MSKTSSPATIIPDADTGRHANGSQPSLENWGQAKRRGRPRGSKNKSVPQADGWTAPHNPRGGAFRREVVEKFSRTMEAPFQCKFCPYQNDSMHSLMMHTNKSHPGKLPGKHAAMAIQKVPGATARRLQQAAQQFYDGHEKGDALDDLVHDLTTTLNTITAMRAMQRMTRGGRR